MGTLIASQRNEDLEQQAELVEQAIRGLGMRSVFFEKRLQTSSCPPIVCSHMMKDEVTRQGVCDLAAFVRHEQARSCQDPVVVARAHKSVIRVDIENPSVH